MEELFEIKRTPEEVNLLSPLTWAYVGDCVYELYIRTKLINETNLKPHKLHIEAIKYVKAKAQAELLQKIYDELTDEEKDIVRRGRNAENHHLPKNSNVQEYMHATAFEALVGYLYLTNQNKRIKEILKRLTNIKKNDINRRCQQGPLVKRLRRHPLKVEPWVRFPYGSPHIL